jgi:hypothetical protein
VETTTTSTAETTTSVAETSGHERDTDAGDSEITPEIAAQVAQIRAGTAKYANNLDAAAEDGFFIITQMIPDLGYHFLNPNVEGFDIGQPPILLQQRWGRLGAGRGGVGLSRGAGRAADGRGDLRGIPRCLPLR